TEDQENAFNTLKERLITAPILAYSDFSQEFFLFMNALGVTLGAILSQKDPQGKEQVIHYASRTMTPEKKTYLMTEQECLAIV
ncbi:35639_t:CDS:1, partial [Racocetra persica]